MLTIIHYVFITKKEKYEQHKNSFDEHFMLTSKLHRFDILNIKATSKL